MRRIFVVVFLVALLFIGFVSAFDDYGQWYVNQTVDVANNFSASDYSAWCTARAKSVCGGGESCGWLYSQSFQGAILEFPANGVFPASLGYPFSGSTWSGNSITDIILLPKCYPYTYDGQYPGHWVPNDVEWTPVPSVCSFIASPVFGEDPLLVLFTDTSTNNVTARAWNITNNVTSVGKIQANLQSFSQYLNGAGSWDIELSAQNPYGTCNIFSPKYITVSNASLPVAHLTLRFVDSVSGALIQDTAVGVFDWNNTEWYNVTANTGILAVDFTGASLQYPVTLGEVILVAADADGYAGTAANVTVLYDGYVADIHLNPVGTIPGASNSTVVFHVVSNSNSQSLENVMISLSNSSYLYSQTHWTNAAGSATFAELPVGVFQWGTYKAGYQSATAYVATAGGVITEVDVSLVAIGATPTPTGVPTTGATAGVTPDTRTAAQKDAAMMDLIRQYGPDLVMLAIIATVIGLIKIMGKK